MTEITPPVLAISPENDTAHVGPPEVVLPHVIAERPSAESGRRIVQWEYYDAKGRLVVEQDDDAGAKVLVLADPDGDAPDRAARQLLVRRIGLTLANAQLRLDAEIAAVGGAGPNDLVEMVQVNGELEHVLVMLSALEALKPTAGTPPDPGSWLHNWMDAVLHRK